MGQRREIRIGTSGWDYAHWKGPFYPEALRNEDLLPSYAESFDTVELNNTFYRLPERRTIHRWREAVPEGFIFSVKASRHITHMKKLKDPKTSVKRFLERVEEFGEALGPILFQLPPRWRVDPGRLESFLGVLPRGHRYAFEFRDPSWFDDRIYGLLREHGAAFCVYELAGVSSPREVTAGFVYVRLHGPGGAYQGSYEPSALPGWVGALSTWSKERAVYCYFDNDEGGYAAKNAMGLRRMLAPA